ncbi:MAG: pilus assembly PilX N-terminal domain-containing protein [Pseudomonadota bacterium]
MRIPHYPGHPRHPRCPHHLSQRGATLLVAMIILVLMSLLAVSAYKGSTSNLKVVGNMQVRQEALAAGQEAVERTLSSSLFTTNPASVLATPVTVDIDGNGTADYTATMTPQPKCFRANAIKNSELNTALAADLSCLQSSVVQQGGLDSALSTSVTGNSLCAKTEWDIAVAVTDAKSGAKVTIHQGVSVRVLDADATNSCI